MKGKIIKSVPDVEIRSMMRDLSIVQPVGKAQERATAKTGNITQQ